MLTMSAFQYVPPFAQGVVRDLRVRWALEEAGELYDVRLIGPPDQKSPEYLALQPCLQDVHKRLGQLAAWLGERDYLDGAFSAGDLMMTTVLRLLRHTTIIDDYPTLKAYQARCETRPAFQKALRDQMAAFERR